MAAIIKITEESTCEIGGGCNFLWKDTATCKVTTTTWAAEVLTIAGTGFGTVVGDTTVYLGNRPQTVTAVTDTEISVTAS